MVEVCEDGVAPLLNGEHQWRVGWIQFSRNRVALVEVGRFRLRAGWLVVDGNEAFLQFVPLPQQGDALDPALQHEQVFWLQVVFPAEQKVAVVHLKRFALRLSERPAISLRSCSSAIVANFSTWYLSATSVGLGENHLDPFPVMLP